METRRQGDAGKYLRVPLSPRLCILKPRISHLNPTSQRLSSTHRWKYRYLISILDRIVYGNILPI